MRKTASEQMIEPDVENDPGVAPKWWCEQRPREDNGRMRVGKNIDGAMQAQTDAYLWRQRRIDRTAHEIAEHAADDAIGIGSGQQGVSEVIHAIGARACACRVQGCLPYHPSP